MSDFNRPTSSGSIIHGRSIRLLGCCVDWLDSTYKYEIDASDQLLCQLGLDSVLRQQCRQVWEGPVADLEDLRELAVREGG